MDNKPDLFPEEDKSSFEAAFTWWEKRRLRYNIIVGATGLLLLLADYGLWTLHRSFIFSVLWVVVLFNVCYCLGCLGELFLKHYFHSTIDFAEKRNTIFWTGTLLSIFALLAFTFLAEILK